jgi:hypothetical protein
MPHPLIRHQELNPHDAHEGKSEQDNAPPRTFRMQDRGVGELFD